MDSLTDIAFLLLIFAEQNPRLDFYACFAAGNAPWNAYISFNGEQKA
jgi:hypothetical protein